MRLNLCLPCIYRPHYHVDLAIAESSSNYAILFCSKWYAKKCEDTGRKNVFIMKEKIFTLGKKQLTLGGKGSLARWSKTPPVVGNALEVIEEKNEQVYYRQSFTAYRDSILEL